jgi:hypothetical protein
MFVFYTFKLQEYKTKKTEDTQNFQHLAPWPHDFEFKTKKEERLTHSHNFNKPHWFYCFLNIHATRPKNQKKKPN